jgi:hypothetical protein
MQKVEGSSPFSRFPESLGLPGLFVCEPASGEPGQLRRTTPLYNKRALWLLHGEMSEIVTTGQRVLPARLLEFGFQFRHPEVEPALRDVLALG